MTKIVRDNARDAGGKDPAPLTKAFTYNKDTCELSDKRIINLMIYYLSTL